MKQGFFKRSLVAAAMVGVMAYAAAEAQAVQFAGNEVMARVTQQQVQQWVDGFQQTFPYYQASLEEFRSEGDFAYAMATFSMGSVAGLPLSEGGVGYMRFEVPIEIEHGVFLENGQAGVARVRFRPNLAANSSAELVALLGTEPLYEAQGLVTPGGELQLSFSSIVPFVQDFEGLVWEVPSYSGSFYSYGGARLGHMDTVVPQLRLSGMGYRSDSEVVIENLRVLQHDKPLREGVYDLNGHTEVSIDRVIVGEGEQRRFFELSGLSYVEDALVDDSGLYQGHFTASGSGVAYDSNRSRCNRGEARDPVPFGFEVAGSLVNLPAEPYVRLLSRMGNGSLYEVGIDELEGDLFDLLQYGPRLDIDKYAITLNGYQGDFKASIGFEPFTESDRRMEFFLLIAQKLRVNASMDIPVQWIELFSDGKGDMGWVDEMVSQGYITRKGDRLVSSFVYDMGNMTVNGQPLRGLGGF